MTHPGATKWFENKKLRKKQRADGNFKRFEQNRLAEGMNSERMREYYPHMYVGRP